MRDHQFIVIWVELYVAVCHNCGIVDETWRTFRDTITGLVEDHVPHRPRRAPDRQVLMNRGVMRALRKKKKLWKWARCGPEEMKKDKEAEKEASNAKRNAKRNLQKKLSKEKRKRYEYKITK